MTQSTDLELEPLSAIWEPLTIGTTTVKHRILHTATTLLYAEDNILSDRHIAYFRERAMGGSSLLITEQQAAHPISKGSFHACTSSALGSSCSSTARESMTRAR